MSRCLGIDTSNYTTSAAICEDGAIKANCKLPLRVEKGARGLRQSDAVFGHTVNLPELITALAGLNGGRKFDAVGVSVSPRDEDGSYMPCFLAGRAFAASYAALDGLPLFSFSHQAGHVTAAVYSSGHPELFSESFLAFHVSGGTTELLSCDGTGGRLTIKLLGGTKDLNAGQAVDRVGVKLGLSFPCGMELERLAKEYLKAGGTVEKPKICVDGLYCNLSGLENLTDKMLENGSPAGEVALYTLNFIRDTLDRLTENALREYPSSRVLFSGGVASNSLIRERLTEKYGAFFAEPSFSSDNAAGIALLCHMGLTGEKMRRPPDKAADEDEK